MEESDKNTVQQVAGGDIVLIGEEHGNPLSADLASSVINDLEPRTLAIEMDASSRKPVISSGAMGRVRNYAEKNDLPLLKIDQKDYRNEISSNIRLGKLFGIGNDFSHPIQEDGDVDWKAIRNARMNVLSEFGEEVHHYFYEYRERAMAGRLKKAMNEFETPILAAVGTFHILAIRSLFEVVEEREIGDRRVFYSRKIEEDTEAIA